ncbi:MAG: hypothetical protein PHE54_03335 [Bacilli bacterium]|nr:hypothetical protein [Bacilli bacterium]
MPNKDDIFSKLDGNKNLTPDKKETLKERIALIDKFMKSKISSTFSLAGLEQLTGELTFDDNVDLGDREVINFSFFEKSISVSNRFDTKDPDYRYLLTHTLLIMNMRGNRDDNDAYGQNIGLNVGIASQCAKIIDEGNVSNFGYEPFRDEEISFNLLSSIVGVDILIDMFVRNNPTVLVDALLEMKYDRSEIFELINTINANYDNLINNPNAPSKLGDIQILLAQMLFRKNDLTDIDISTFRLNMIDSPNQYDDVLYPNIEKSIDVFDDLKKEHDKNLTR